MADIRFMNNGGNEEQGIYRSLEYAVKIAEHAVPADRGVVFWSPAHRAEDHTDQRRVIAVRVPGEGVYEIEDRHWIYEWWQNLPADVRDSLAADPGKVLTGDEIVAVTNTRPHAMRAASVAFVDAEDSDEGRYRLFQDEQHFIRAMTS